MRDEGRGIHGSPAGTVELSRGRKPTEIGRQRPPSRVAVAERLVRHLCRRYAACLVCRTPTVGLRPRLNSRAATRLTARCGTSGGKPGSWQTIASHTGRTNYTPASSRLPVRRASSSRSLATRLTVSDGMAAPTTAALRAATNRCIHISQR
jgi:hypothetical protein